MGGGRKGEGTKREGRNDDVRKEGGWMWKGRKGVWRNEGEWMVKGTGDRGRGSDKTRVPIAGILKTLFPFHLFSRLIKYQTSS